MGSDYMLEENGHYQYLHTWMVQIFAVARAFIITQTSLIQYYSVLCESAKKEITPSVAMNISSNLVPCFFPFLLRGVFLLMWQMSGSQEVWLVEILFHVFLLSK